MLCTKYTFTFNFQKGQTALMYSIRGQHENVSEKLIVAGSDARIKDKVSYRIKHMQLADGFTCRNVVNKIHQYVKQNSCTL